MQPLHLIYSSDTDDDAIKKGNEDEQNGNDHGRTVPGIGRAINRELRAKFFLPAGAAALNLSAVLCESKVSQWLEGIP